MLEETLCQEYPKTRSLKNGKQLTVRLLEATDVEALYIFFQSISREDRIFLKDDIRDKTIIEEWCNNIDWDVVVPIVAIIDDKIVAEVSLHRERRGWKSHIGKLRLVVHPDYRRQGLAIEMINELIFVALHTGSIEQLNAECMIDAQRGVILLLQLVGFVQRAILPDQVRDIEGKHHDLALLSYTLRDQEDFPALD
tara:strand:+ start:22447 stop:23034 length:588 start_codon:yes stop_codon:yes gene_type:complete